MQIIHSLYKLAICFWVGGMAIFTFVLTPILFKSYDRDMAGQIVGMLFPSYFRWGLVCGTVALVAMLIIRSSSATPAVIIMVCMLSLGAFGAFYIEPKAAALKKEIPSFVTTPKDHPARKQFARLHGISAVCNLLQIAGGVVLVILL